ncbi:nuclear transport factor 2 family protein [Chitinophaga sp. Mgbs1]|uniref:Nuclear transport factor 2 family protein n=1 Tax=Chitinophaga solisilvae TaxID=1233460 RepID=A0A433WGK4_9BACT|nr:nuclear transport factor 2 family protein [Chitinophaga solisilvae]
MNTSLLTNATVKQAITALQAADEAAWLALFTPDAILLDDGNKRDFRKFSKEAMGHEHFTSIDKVEKDGLRVLGHFHSDQWGDFKTYFEFELTNDGKIKQLSIGQAR